MLSKISAVLFLLNHVLSLPTSPVPPSQDPFYTPPAGYESAHKVGQIIAHRPVPGNLATLPLPEKVQNAWQLLVRSEDSFGNPIAIVTTLIQPFNADPSKLLSYQTAEDSTFINCAPSYTLQSGVVPDSLAQIESIFLVAALDQGWYVVVPDHEGPKSALGCGFSQGKATLNSLRAVYQSGAFTGINSNPTTALWGYSGGTVPSGYAALLAPTYAPEIKLAGTAIGGVLANTTDFTLSGSTGGLPISTFVGFAHEFPDFNTSVYQHLLPGAASTLQYVQTHCTVEDTISNLFTSVWSLFDVGQGIMDIPAIAEVFDNANMIQESYLPNSPIFMYHAKADEFSPFDSVQTLYNNWCNRGASVNFQVDLTGEHITEDILGSGKAFVWLKDRLNCKTVSKGCNQSNNLSNAFDLNAIITMGGFVVGELLALLGKPIGP